MHCGRFLAALLWSVATTSITVAQDERIGQDLAKRLCARCHAISKVDVSPVATAPPFRVIANRYSVWLLQEALAEGIVTGHPDMPEFILAPGEIADLLTFMDTLKAPKRSSE